MKFKTGDVVVLLGGGPTMTVHSINAGLAPQDVPQTPTVLCVYFDGAKEHRVVFDERMLMIATVATVIRNSTGLEVEALWLDRPTFADTARRLTNLLRAEHPEEVADNIWEAVTALETMCIEIPRPEAS